MEERQELLDHWKWIVRAVFQTIMNKLGDSERIYEVVEKCGGMQVNEKKDVPVSTDEVTNLNAERK